MLLFNFYIYKDAERNELREGFYREGHLGFVLYFTGRYGENDEIIVLDSDGEGTHILKKMLLGGDVNNFEECIESLEDRF